MAPGRVLLTGASGFVGGSILRALAVCRSVRVRALLRDPDVVTTTATVTPVPGDLCRPESVLDACAGVDIVVHAASYVGGDPARCSAVNETGTECLVRAARAAGVRRIVYVSTASVHGRGSYRRAEPSTTPTRPESVASASRLAAERVVLDAGGVVVRPHLVYGVGDRWFVPALVRLVNAVGTDVGDPAALHSIVHVDELGRAVAALATNAGETWPTRVVLGGSHPAPTTTADLVDTVVRELGLTGAPRRTEGDRHDAALLATDHWFDSAALWERSGVDPGPAFAAGFRRCAPWYRQATAALLAGA